MSNLTKRILSALFLIPLVLALVFLASTPIFIIGISAISALSGYELASFSLPSPFRRLSFVTATLCAALTASISVSPIQPDILIFTLPSAVILLFFSFMFLNKPSEDTIRALSFSFFGVMYVGVLMGFIGLIASSSDIESHGRFAILLLLVGTFMGDTGAYTFGRLFGKHLMAPKLSPKKTWEGAFGGLFSTTLSVFLIRLFLLPSISILQAIFLSVLLSFFCQIGDLAESFVKRSMGVKDSGNIIPGHGGILDRIDALLFGAPVVYAFSLFF